MTELRQGCTVLIYCLIWILLIEVLKIVPSIVAFKLKGIYIFTVFQIIEWFFVTKVRETDQALLLDCLALHKPLV